MIGMRMWCSKVRAGERWKTQGKRNKETWEPQGTRNNVAGLHPLHPIFRPKLIHCGDSGTMQWGSIETASTAEFQKGNSVEFENTRGNSRKFLKLKIAFFAQMIRKVSAVPMAPCFASVSDGHRGRRPSAQMRCISWLVLVLLSCHKTWAMHWNSRWLEQVDHNSQVTWFLITSCCLNPWSWETWTDLS